MDKIIVTLFGFSLVGFIYWFFFSKRERVVAVLKNVTITVNGGYNPATITVPKGENITINFRREDPSPCLEEVVLPDFGIRKYLPLGETVSIEIKAQSPGEFQFACGMNMYHGKIIAT